MKVTEVPAIAGAFLFEPTPFTDERGFFCRTFDADVVRSAGIDPDAFVQDSLSRSVRGVVRGMHLRSGEGEAKLVRCSHGRIFDVVVDLRPGSPTYLRRATFELSGDTQATLYVAGGLRARLPGADGHRRHVVPDRPRARPVGGRDDRLRRPRTGRPLAAAGHADVRTGPQGAGSGGGAEDAGGEDAMSGEEWELPRSRAVNERLHAAVPGGAHTYAKGDDQYPQGLAPVIDHGRGARVWDVDGNEYLEYGSGLRSVSLGHAHPRVLEAVRRELERGSNFVRPSVVEAQAAERFLATVPTAEMVKFAKNGSDATTAAVRLARAVTGRTRVALCADHPFFSVDDWFIGTTPMSAGIPSQTTDLTVTFPYGDLAAVEALFDRYPDEIACLILELPPRRSRRRVTSQGCATSRTATGACWSSTR